MSPTNSIYIPRVHIPVKYRSEKWQVMADQARNKIIHTLSILEIADVASVDIKPHKTSQTGAMAFVHIKEWHATESASSIVTRMKETGNARLVYNDPHYWILLPWNIQKNITNSDQNKDSSNLQDRINTLENTYNYLVQQNKKIMSDMVLMMQNTSIQNTPGSTISEDFNQNGKRPRVKNEE